MSGTINIGDLPSWVLVLLIGLGVSWATSNGMLTEYSGLGNVMVVCGLALGAFYFWMDISNKA